MAAKKKAVPKKAARSRKRLTLRKEKRGLSGNQVLLGLSSREVAPLVAQVEAAGGTALGAYREPLSGRPVLLAALGLNSVKSADLALVAAVSSDDG